MEEFKESQEIAYNLLNNAFKTGKIANAYLIDDNGTKQGFDLACSFCSLLIDSKIELSGNALIIEPDGASIKKEQIDEIKEKFATKAIIGKNKVYIIKNAEKLNPASSSALLKFLEEPEPNIVAILVTDNINQVLETIKSRCVLVPLVHKNGGNLDKLDKIKNAIFMQEAVDIDLDKVDEAISFLEYVDKNKTKTLIHLKKILKNNKFDKIDTTILFNIMLLFYKDVLEYKTLQKVSVFDDYLTNIKNISFNNTDIQIINKIKLIIEVLDDLKYNVNIQMEFDKFILRQEEL